MKLRNYILIAFVKTEGAQQIKDDLLELANTQPRYVCVEDYMLASFSSTFEPIEIRNYINQISGRMFFIFDADDRVSAANLPPKIQQHLFKDFDKKTNNLSLTSTENDKEEYLDVKIASGITESLIIDVGTLSAVRRMEMINDLFDKGLENLNAKDKELLDILSKKT